MRDKFGYLERGEEQSRKPSDDSADPTYGKGQPIREDSDHPEFSISIEDVDRAVTEHVDSYFDFHVRQNGESVKVPVIWDNPERWVWARKQSQLKSLKNKVLYPLVILKRSSYSQNDNMPTRPEFTRYGDSKGKNRAVREVFSRRNRYDKFTDDPGERQPEYEVYTVAIPRYVEVSYEVTIYTERLWQLDKITDRMMHERSTFWGESRGLKFHTEFSQVNTDVQTDDDARYCEAQLSLTVKGYIIPEDSRPEKTYTLSKIRIEESTGKLPSGYRQS